MFIKLRNNTIGKQTIKTYMINRISKFEQCDDKIVI